MTDFLLNTTPDPKSPVGQACEALGFSRWEGACGAGVQFGEGPDTPEIRTALEHLTLVLLAGRDPFSVGAS